MAVYVDRSSRKLGRMTTCHLLADTIAELHDMADRIGSRREWFQISRTGVPHYDIPLFRKAAALRLGAIEVGNRETAAIMKRIRLLPNYLPPDWPRGTGCVFPASNEFPTVADTALG